MTFLTEAERQRIERAIADAERRTTGEFVTVIAAASGRYLYVPTLVAACAVFIVSGLVLLLPLNITFGTYYAGQVVGFLMLVLLLRWGPIKMRLVPRPIQQRQAHLLAHEQFLDLGLSSTSKRTGVMLFVSVAEHYVEIIADRGIQERVNNEVWERIVDDFIARVRDKRIADGFIAAIEACTNVLAEHFPWQADDVNELPNRLVPIGYLTARAPSR